MARRAAGSGALPLRRGARGGSDELEASLAPSTGAAGSPGQIRPRSAETSQGPRPSSAPPGPPPRAFPPFPKASSEESVTPCMNTHEHRCTHMNTHAQLSPATRPTLHCRRDPKPSGPASRALPKLLPSAVALGCCHQPGRSPTGTSWGTRHPRHPQTLRPRQPRGQPEATPGHTALQRVPVLFKGGSFPSHRAPRYSRRGNIFWLLQPPWRPHPALHLHQPLVSPPLHKQGCNARPSARARPQAPEHPPGSDLTPGEPPAGARGERKTFLHALQKSTASSLKTIKKEKKKRKKRGEQLTLKAGCRGERAAQWDGELLPRWHRLSPARAAPCPPQPLEAQPGMPPSTGRRGSLRPGDASQTPGRGGLWDRPQHRRKTRSSEGRDEVKTQLPLSKTRPRAFCSQHEMS